ncbi:MAG: hypothetical protein V4686_02410 [Patescibacteria group bacterium]
MKAKLNYLDSFTIPTNLPHAEGDTCHDILGDSVGICEKHGVKMLCLSSNKGSTFFHSWRDAGDHYIIPADTTAEYEGAYHALNAVWGIKFPDCDVSYIESTIGNYNKLADYEKARRLILPIVRNFQRFTEVKRRNQEDAAHDQAVTWLAGLESAVGTVIDLNDCGNPLHPDGTVGRIS